MALQCLPVTCKGLALCLEVYTERLFLMGSSSGGLVLWSGRLLGYRVNVDQEHQQS